MSRILVTGASGFIGRHLVRALVEAGNTVTCLVRRESAVESLQTFDVRLCVGDVTDADSLTSAVAGQDVVYHLAGRTRALSANQFFAVNEEGTRAVAQACANQMTPPVLVSVSSLAAAGPSTPDRPHIETDPDAPVSHYGRSKRAGELAIAAMAHRIPATIVRPPIVIGFGDRLGLPLFASVARFGLQALPSLASPRFSMIHVADLVALLTAAAEKGERLDGRPPEARNNSGDRNDGATGQGLYYVSCGYHPTLGEFAHLIARAAGRRHTIVLPLPSPVTWSVAAIMELFAHVSRHPLSLNLDKAREATAGDWTCSARKASDQLGFLPAESLAKRVQETVEGYRQAGWL